MAAAAVRDGPVCLGCWSAAPRPLEECMHEECPGFDEDGGTKWVCMKLTQGAMDRTVQAEVLWRFFKKLAHLTQMKVPFDLVRYVGARLYAAISPALSGLSSGHHPAVFVAGAAAAGALFTDPDLLDTLDRFASVVVALVGSGLTFTPSGLHAVTTFLRSRLCLVTARGSGWTSLDALCMQLSGEVAVVSSQKILGTRPVTAPSTPDAVVESAAFEVCLCSRMASVGARRRALKDSARERVLGVLAGAGGRAEFVRLYQSLPKELFRGGGFWWKAGPKTSFMAHWLPAPMSGLGRPRRLPPLPQKWSPVFGDWAAFLARMAARLLDFIPVARSGFTAMVSASLLNLDALYLDVPRDRVTVTAPSVFGADVLDHPEWLLPESTQVVSDPTVRAIVGTFAVFAALVRLNAACPQLLMTHVQQTVSSILEEVSCVRSWWSLVSTALEPLTTADPSSIRDNSLVCFALDALYKSKMHLPHTLHWCCSSGVVFDQTRGQPPILHTLVTVYQLGLLRPEVQGLPRSSMWRFARPLVLALGHSIVVSPRLPCDVTVFYEEMFDMFLMAADPRDRQDAREVICQAMAEARARARRSQPCTQFGAVRQAFVEAAMCVAPDLHTQLQGLYDDLVIHPAWSALRAAWASTVARVVLARGRVSPWRHGAASKRHCSGGGECV